MLSRVKKPILLAIASIVLWPVSFLFQNPDADTPVGLLFHGEWALDVAMVMIAVALTGFAAGLVWLCVSLILYLKRRGREPGLDRRRR